MSSIPRRPARPVSWVYSPGVRNSWRSPVYFDSFSMTTDRAGGEGALHRLLEGRHHPGVVGGDAGLEAAQPVAVVQDPQVVVGQRLHLGLGDGPDRGPLLGRGQAQAGVEA